MEKNMDQLIIYPIIIMLLKKPSHDLMYSLYWWRGFWNYKNRISVDLELYTQNKNLGDSFTSNLSGKRVSFFGEPQVWFKIITGLAVGRRSTYIITF